MSRAQGRCCRRWAESGGESGDRRHSEQGLSDCRHTGGMHSAHRGVPGGGLHPHHARNLGGGPYRTSQTIWRCCAAPFPSEERQKLLTAEFAEGTQSSLINSAERFLAKIYASGRA